MATTSYRSDDDAPAVEPGYPRWFSVFLADRAVRKPSPHTAKAYRQDFTAIAELLTVDRARIGERRPHRLLRDGGFAVLGECLIKCCRFERPSVRGAVDKHIHGR